MGPHKKYPTHQLIMEELRGGERGRKEGREWEGEGEGTGGEPLSRMSVANEIYPIKKLIFWVCYLLELRAVGGHSLCPSEAA